MSNIGTLSILSESEHPSPSFLLSQLAVLSFLQWVFAEQLLGIMSIGKVVDKVVAFQGLCHTNRTADGVFDHLRFLVTFG